MKKMIAILGLCICGTAIQAQTTTTNVSEYVLPGGKKIEVVEVVTAEETVRFVAQPAQPSAPVVAKQATVLQAPDDYDDAPKKKKKRSSKGERSSFWWGKPRQETKSYQVTVFGGGDHGVLGGLLRPVGFQKSEFANE